MKESRSSPRKQQLEADQKALSSDLNSLGSKVDKLANSLEVLVQNMLRFTNKVVPPPPFPHMHRDVQPPPSKSEVPPPPSSPTPKPQPHIEEDSGLSIEVSKNDEVSGEKGRDEGDGDRIFRVEVGKGSYKVVVDRVVRVRMGDRGKLKPCELLKWFCEQRWEINLFRVGNYLRLRWENLKRVKMKENKEF